MLKNCLKLSMDYCESKKLLQPQSWWGWGGRDLYIHGLLTPKKNPPVIHNEKSKEYALLVREEIEGEKPL